MEEREIDTIRAWDLLNVACLSEILTGNKDYIRKGHLKTPKKVPKKYRKKVYDLVQFIEAWIIKHEDEV